MKKTQFLVISILGKIFASSGHKLQVVLWTGAIVVSST